jgi:F0F1-type ATP synthase beta subunit
LINPATLPFEIPEQAFYMVGTIEEALKKAEKMKAGS